MRALPDPPPVHLLPAAVRSAERLRGTLVSCGPGHRAVGWPDTPRVRAAALAGFCTMRSTIALEAAAWVWGALRSPGHPVTIAATGGGTAAERFNPALHTHDLTFGDGETVRFGGVQVSTPLRTLYDLLRLRDEFEAPERVCGRLLLRLVPGGAAVVTERISTQPAPYRRRALERLTALHSS